MRQEGNIYFSFRILGIFWHLQGRGRGPAQRSGGGGQEGGGEGLAGGVVAEVQKIPEDWNLLIDSFILFCQDFPAVQGGRKDCRRFDGRKLDKKDGSRMHNNSMHRNRANYLFPKSLVNR